MSTALDTSAVPNMHIVNKGAWLMAARNDVNAFISYCFLNKRKQKKFHAEWHKDCDENDYLVLFAPLEHGKTEQISIWRSIWLLGRDPELRIWILSSTGPLASKIVTAVAELILTNEKVTQVFPHLIPEERKGRHQQWNTKGLTVERELNSKDPSLQATGIMGSAIGSRVDLLIGDDVMNFKNTFFIAQRDRVEDWFKSAECMGRITAGGKCVLVNTPWHEKALAHVAARELGFKQINYRACDDNFENILWPKEKSIGRVCGFDVARLEDKRRRMGPVEFARCYLGKEMTERTQWFSMGSMTNCIDRELKFNTPIPQSMVPICGIDPGTGKRTSAETAFFYGGVDPATGLKQVSMIKYGKFGAMATFKEIIRIHRISPSCNFIVEANAQQDFLIQIINTKEMMIAVGATEHEASRLRYLVRPFYTGVKKSDPNHGIPNMGADFEARTWRIPHSHESESWFRQALEYKPGYRTGDVMMASYFFWSEANRISTRRATVNPTIRSFLRAHDHAPEFAGIREKVF